MNSAATIATAILIFVPVALMAETATVRALTWREAPASASDSDLDRLSRAFVELAEQVRPAVVQIRTTGPDGKNAAASGTGTRGSGFIIDSRGYLLTAHHVIDKAKEIEIRIADGQRLAAHIVAVETQLDLAILKVQSDRELPILSLGDSETIRVGDLAFVFGYPIASRRVTTSSRPMPEGIRAAVVAPCSTAKDTSSA